MDYKVIWDEEANQELVRAVRRVAQDNPIAARKIGGEIFAKAGRLGAFPRFGRVFPKLGRDDVRKTSVRPYRIVYHLNDSSRIVRILTVWHGARQEPEISTHL